jgi:hypothetical protein
LDFYIAGSTYGQKLLDFLIEPFIPIGGTVVNLVHIIENGILLFTIGFIITFT